MAIESPSFKSLETMKFNIQFCSPPSNIQSLHNKDAGCQTLSTGDIVIMKVYFKEDQEKGERVIVSSPKRSAQSN